ncbi:MAG TPA: biopolymer transporter ExbD [Nevskiaceae bacterium]|nr:biopolymer transporter ExbD [Nevskiaceae bacterium]
MKLADRPRTRRPLIDMVPMINFAFLLLIFFVLAGHAGARDASRAALAHAPDAPSARAGASELVMAPDGQLSWDQAAVAPEQLLDHARAWQAAHAHTALRVHAPATVSAASVIDVLQVLRAAQVAQVTLAVR